MKYLLILLIASLFITCKPNKLIMSERSTELKANSLKSFCPEDGKCSIRIEKNQELIIKSDEFGKLYYQTIANEETSIVIYEYERNVPDGLQDGSHREEIIFEIKNSSQKLQLKDSNLSQIKMIYGRHCFCKGQAGYYFVKQGNLDLSVENNLLDLNLNFTINEVPQIIKNILTIKK